MVENHADETKQEKKNIIIIIFKADRSTFSTSLYLRKDLSEGFFTWKSR